MRNRKDGLFVPDAPPGMPERDAFMPGDKVQEVLPCGLEGQIYRVKARFTVTGVDDWITLEDVETHMEYTIYYYPLASRLKLICRANDQPPAMIR